MMDVDTVDTEIVRGPQSSETPQPFKLVSKNDDGWIEDVINSDFMKMPVPDAASLCRDNSVRRMSLFGSNHGMAYTTMGDHLSLKAQLAGAFRDILGSNAVQASNMSLNAKDKSKDSSSKSLVQSLTDKLIEESVQEARIKKTTTAEMEVKMLTDSSSVAAGALSDFERTELSLQPVAGASAAALIPRSGAAEMLSHIRFRTTPRRPAALWHPKWKLKRVISGHTGWVRTLAVDPSNEWFVSGGNDKLLKIWDLASGTLKLSLTGHIEAIRDLEVSKRHPYIFSCGEDNTVKCWDLEENKVVRQYHGHLSGVYSLCVHPELDVLASGGRDAAVKVWDMRTKNCIHTLSGHSSTVMSLSAQASEPQLVSGSADKMIRYWDLRAGKCSVVLTNHKRSVRDLAIHPRENVLLSAAADNLKVWQFPRGNFERNLDKCDSLVHCVKIKDDPESCVAVAGTDNGHLFFWDWQSGKQFQMLESRPQAGSLSSEAAIFDCCFDISETRLLTAECDKTIKVWQEDESSLPDQDVNTPGLRLALESSAY